MWPAAAGSTTRRIGVRREIAAALTHGLQVIPVLTSDGQLPAEVDSFPVDLRGPAGWRPTQGLDLGLDVEGLRDQAVELPGPSSSKVLGEIETALGQATARRF
jgi:hypothetical protein